MKKSEKLAITAGIFGVIVCVGLNYWLGSEVWPWYVHAVLWGFRRFPLIKRSSGSL